MSKRILIIDDEAHIVQVLLLKLRNAGYSVLTACDGEEGLEVASAHVPDLIITDFQMPYMTGLELCRALVKDARLSGIPVVMLTARGYALDAEDLACVGVDGRPIIRSVMSKPFSPRGIVELIEKILDVEELQANVGNAADSAGGWVAAATDRDVPEAA